MLRVLKKILAVEPVCKYEGGYVEGFVGRSIFESSCGHHVSFGGMPRLSNSKCGYCNKKIKVSDEYRREWIRNNPGYMWRG